MGDSVLSEPERLFLRTLNELGVRYMLVDMSAALLQGARGATEDLDLWFENITDPMIVEAAKRAGGLWVSGTFGMRPPALGGYALGDRFDVVVHMLGLENFDSEFARARIATVDDVQVYILPLERIIVSKRATGRAKDGAQLPALEEALAVKEKVK